MKFILHVFVLQVLTAQCLQKMEHWSPVHVSESTCTLEGTHILYINESTGAREIHAVQTSHTQI